MKKIILLFVIAHLTLNAQWVQTSGPVGANVTSFFKDGSNIYVGTGSGVFKSVDNGSTWNMSATGLPMNKDVKALVLLGTNLFAGFWGDGVFISSNNGSSWNSVSSTLSNKYVTSLFADGSRLFAGTNSGLFVSQNNGSTWTALTTGLPVNVYVNCIDKIGSNLIVGTNGTGLFKSGDNGASFTDISTGLDDKYIKDLAVSDNVLYVACWSSILTTTDVGATYTRIRVAQLTINALAVSGNNIFYSVSAHGFYKSTNKGSSWETISTYMSSTWNLFYIDGSNVYAGGTSGLFFSNDNGTTWVNKNIGAINTYVKTLIHNNNNIFTGSYFGVGLSSANTSGTTWNQIKYCPDVISLFNDNGTLYAGVVLDGVLRSNDNGNTWNKISNNIPNGTVYAVAANGSKIFAGTPGYGVYYSSDNGTTWNAVNNGLTNNFIQALAINGNNIYAGSNSAGIFLSTNNGTDWTQTALNNKNIITIKVYDNKIYAGTWGDGIYVSSNNGTSWTQINNGLDTHLVYSICFDNNNIYATIQESVFFSTNGGQNWFKANSGLPQINIWSIDVVGNYLFVGTGGMGIWKRPISELITNVQGEIEIPSNYSLEQNYPNPFNPTTTIRYSIPKAGLVTLKVYDLQGKEVATLVNEFKQPGNYNSPFSLQNSRLASGIYFYKITSGKYSETKKMIILK